MEKHRLIGGHMFNLITQAIEVLTTRKSKDKIRFHHFKQLMEDIGSPQKKLKVIHIAGTNGKGSTTDFIRSILNEAGLKVGSFTSPHLVSHHDRFRINNIPISDQDLLRYINQSVVYWDTYDLTMFEIDVLIAVNYFLDEKVDIALFEVGLGGRLDATNIVDPIASVITNISYDHMAFLGNTLTEIAGEKAGIIKENGIVVTGEKREELLSIFKEKAKREIFCPKEIISLSKGAFKYRDQLIQLKTIAPYQHLNASLAYETIYQLSQHKYLDIDQKTIKKGLENTAWLGRFQFISSTPPILVDGAHNMAGIKALVDGLKELQGPFVFVFAALKDKETDSMLSVLCDHAEKVIVTEFEFERVKKADDLGKGFDVIIESDFKLAIKKGIHLSKNGTLVITGSLYFISEVLAWWKEYDNS